MTGPDRENPMEVERPFDAPTPACVRAFIDFIAGALTGAKG